MFTSSGIAPPLDTVIIKKDGVVRVFEASGINEQTAMTLREARYIEPVQALRTIRVAVIGHFWDHAACADTR